MPNESVNCPSCGSPTCTEYRANAFVCQNCDGTFRWLNPTEFTVVHRGGTCDCGRRGVGGCTLCRTSVCKKHHATWQALFSTWQLLKRSYATDPARGWLQRCVDERFGNDWRDQPSFYRLPHDVTAPVLKQLKHDHCTDVDLLCLACTEALFAKLLRPIENQIGRLDREGRLCELCLIDYKRNVPQNVPQCSRNVPQYDQQLLMASGHCKACGLGFCVLHSELCDRCKTCWCKPHSPPAGFEGCCQCTPPPSRLERIFGWRSDATIHDPPRRIGRP